MRYVCCRSSCGIQLTPSQGLCDHIDLSTFYHVLDALTECAHLGSWKPQNPAPHHAMSNNRSSDTDPSALPDGWMMNIVGLSDPLHRKALNSDNKSTGPVWICEEEAMAVHACLAHLDDAELRAIGVDAISRLIPQGVQGHTFVCAISHRPSPISGSAGAEPVWMYLICLVMPTPIPEKSRMDRTQTIIAGCTSRLCVERRSRTRLI